MEFKSPVLVVVRNLDDPLQFVTVREFLDWIELQATQWDSVSASLSEDSSRLANSQQFLSEHVSRWRSFLGSARDESSRYEGEQLENQLRQIGSQIQSCILVGQMLWLGDNSSQRVISLAEGDKESALWLLLSLLGKVRWYLVDNNEPRYWMEYTRASLQFDDPKVSAAFLRKQRSAVAEVERLVSGLSEKHEAAVQEGESQKTSFDGLKSEQSLRFDELTALMDMNASEQRSEFNEEWMRLRSAYDRDLKLRAPREYWGKKFVEHEQSSKSWRLAFFVAAAFSAGALSLSVWLLVSGNVRIPTNLGAYGWVVPAAMLGIPAFLSLWILRLFGRQWSDHLLRREDARERVVMIETFLAISRDKDSPGAISDPAQLGIVLSSIFRSGPGMTTDDSPPAGFFEVLMTRAAGGQAKQVP